MPTGTGAPVSSSSSRVVLAGGELSGPSPTGTAAHGVSRPTRTGRPVRPSIATRSSATTAPRQTSREPAGAVQPSVSAFRHVAGSATTTAPSGASPITRLRAEVSASSTSTGSGRVPAGSATSSSGVIPSRSATAVTAATSARWENTTEVRHAGSSGPGVVASAGSNLGPVVITQPSPRGFTKAPSRVWRSP